MSHLAGILISGLESLDAMPQFLLDVSELPSC